MERAPRPCSVPGCPQLVTDATAQCVEHRRRADQQYRRGRPYDTARWHRLSLAYRKRHPVCEGCGRAWSREVDHINGDKLDNRPSNLRALCRLCHGRKTQRTTPGGAIMR